MNIFYGQAHDVFCYNRFVGLIADGTGVMSAMLLKIHEQMKVIGIYKLFYRKLHKYQYYFYANFCWQHKQLVSGL